MSRNKGKKRNKFVLIEASEASESADQLGQLTPLPVGHLGGTPVYESVDAPVGRWTAVPKGMTAVSGCYVDGAGVMRFKENYSPAVWHHPSGCKYHQPPCKRRITDPKDIVYHNNAPWCPDCFGWSAQDEEYKKREVLVEPSDQKMVKVPDGQIKVSNTFIDASGNRHYAEGFVPEGTPEETALEMLRKAVGEFIDATDDEMGSYRSLKPDADQTQIINAASHVVAPEIFPWRVSKQRYYPSGQPRKW